MPVIPALFLELDILTHGSQVVFLLVLFLYVGVLYQELPENVQEMFKTV